MKSLVRGAALMMVLSMLAVIVYAQSKPSDALKVAKDSQPKIDNNNTVKANIQSDIQIDNSNDNKKKKSIENDDKKKLVKTTAMVAARGKRASRGSFSATAYCLKGKTAMGHGVRRGIIAADPRVLRLGSTVAVEGGGYTGSYLVSDTGGKIKGNRIDIWMPSCPEARKFGRRNVQIFSN